MSNHAVKEGSSPSDFVASSVVPPEQLGEDVDPESAASVGTQILTGLAGTDDLLRGLKASGGIAGTSVNTVNNALAGAEGAAPWLKEVGSGVLSKTLSVASGALTTMTHDPALTGVGGLAERGIMGGIDGVWGYVGGPLAVADAVTGGNIGGGLKSFAGGVLALASGDSRTVGRYTESLENGQYGRLAQLGATVGGDMGKRSYDSSLPIVGNNHSLLDSDQMSRDTDREMVRNGLMTWDEYAAKWNAQ